MDTFGALDVLVNNASKQIQCKDLADIDMDNVNDTFQTNIIAYIGVTKEALPFMKRGDVSFRFLFLFFSAKLSDFLLHTRSASS